MLADEINQATPKTQSALLEAMEENQITVEGVTYSCSAFQNARSNSKLLIEEIFESVEVPRSRLSKRAKK
ncbi:MAG: MoxR-like ATPase [Chloroflexi bacterium]|nr:MAG: MoxR-like ATPase [Chloroflexota bacterium]